MKKFENIPYTDSGEYRQSLDLYLPDVESFPVFVYFHGGGIEAGSKENHRFINRLVEMGVCVASANYRLYPIAKFPEFIEDAAEAVAWIKNNISKYGKCTHLFVGGSSAGGYITQMLCFDNRYLAKYGIDADSIDGYYMDAGQPTSHFNVLRERGIDTRRVIVDETAPLYFVSGERNYPPMKIIVSDNDIVNRLEQTVLLVSTLKHFGNDMSKVDFEIAKNSRHCEYTGKETFADMVYEFMTKYTEVK